MALRCCPRARPEPSRRPDARAQARLALSAALALVACESVGVRDAYTALDGQGDRKRDVFYTDTEAIYCVLELSSGIADVTVRTDLRLLALYDNVSGKAIDIDGIVGVEEQVPGVGEGLSVAFQIEPHEDVDYYSAGAYRCEMYINDALVAEQAFEVLHPECPVQPIEDGRSCAGRVLLGSRCPGPFGNRCTCQEEETTDGEASEEEADWVCR